MLTKCRAQTRKENKDLQTGTKHLVKVEESHSEPFPICFKARPGAKPYSRTNFGSFTLTLSLPCFSVQIKPKKFKNKKSVQ